MVEERGEKKLMEMLVPRVLKATLSGLFSFFLVYYLPMLIFPMDLIPFEYDQLFYAFLASTVFFAVVMKLFSDTILEHAFSIVRALIAIVYFIMISNSGVVGLTIPIGEAMVNLVVDLRFLLAIFVLVNFLGVGKSLLRAINFLDRKVETSEL